MDFFNCPLLDFSYHTFHSLLVLTPPVPIARVQQFTIFMKATIGTCRSNFGISCWGMLERCFAYRHMIGRHNQCACNRHFAICYSILYSCIQYRLLSFDMTSCICIYFLHIIFIIYPCTLALALHPHLLHTLRRCYGSAHWVVGPALLHHWAKRYARYRGKKRCSNS